MIKEELNEVYWLYKEIEDLQSRLDELEETNGIGSAPVSDEIHGKGGNSNPIERVAFKKLQYKNELYEKKLTLLEQIRKIERFIETIPDSQIRTIVRLRHIDLWSWENIGEFLGIDRRTATTRYNKFIHKFEKKSKK